MEEKTSVPTVCSESDKPFSILEQFRKLKKDNEASSLSENDVSTSSQTGISTGTVFQTSTVDPNSGETSGSNYHNRGGNRGGRRWGPNEFNRKELRPNNRISLPMHIGQLEADVGITEFLRSGPGFGAIMKHRFTDFQVNEIDLDGKVAKLTSTDIPTDVEPETLVNVEDPNILTPTQWETLHNIVDKELGEEYVELDVTEADKSFRQSVHKAVKKRFGIHIYSNTLDVDGRKVMRIGWATRTEKRLCNWPRGRPEYLHFYLFKENADMTEAINLIARNSSIKPAKFGYAGTKDKRGATTQRISVRRGEAQRFEKCQHLRGISVGNYSYEPYALRLGDLSGNRFKVVLRNVKADDEVIVSAIEELKKNGFINYFGMQRFGQSRQVPTYLVGKAILQHDWKLAVELILKPRPGEDRFRDLSDAKETYAKTGDAFKALKCLRFKDKSIEGKLLAGLKKRGANAYQNAFDELPRHVVTMYLHSYQSLLWNRIVSRRLQTYGLKVLPGDLIEDESNAKNKSEDADHNQESEDEAERDDKDLEGFLYVRKLSEEEVENTSIRQVCFPLPGSDIIMPDNQVAQWYTEFLAEDGFTIESFKQVHKKYGMYGSYRHMLDRVQDVTYRIVSYSNPDEDLLITDLDEFRGKPPIVPSSDGPYKAIILEFNLGVCTYATMAIRELTKHDTSTSSQAKLTNNAEEEYQKSKRQNDTQDDEEVAQKKLKTNEASTSEQSNKETDEPSEDTKLTMEVDSSKVEDGLAENQTVENGAEESRREEKTESDEETRKNDEILRNKREACADNLINKFLEVTYHATD